MFDYKLIEAMAAVVQDGGFEKAAANLCLTQSAVSQRVRLLEEQAGQVLVTRTVPPAVTEAGQQFLAHFFKVKRLEEDLAAKTNLAEPDAHICLCVGVNADSLATWFTEAVCPILAEGKVQLDIRVDDQEQTHKLLRQGKVCGCISTLSRPLQGCRMVELGTMVYHLLCTPAFARQWFPCGVTKEAVSQAPAVIFNRKDELHGKMLAKVLDSQSGEIRITYVPSSQSFVDFIARGAGYGMVPIQQGAPLIKTGKLIALMPKMHINVRLFWHCWNLKSPLLESFTRTLIQGARKSLNMKN